LIRRLRFVGTLGRWAIALNSEAMSCQICVATFRQPRRNDQLAMSEPRTCAPSRIVRTALARKRIWEVRFCRVVV